MLTGFKRGNNQPNCHQADVVREREKESPHENTFLKVCELVSKEVIINQTVIKLTLYVKGKKSQLTKNTFLKVCELVSKEVIINQTVIKLTLYVKGKKSHLTKILF